MVESGTEGAKYHNTLCNVHCKCIQRRLCPSACRLHSLTGIQW